jgi:DNA-directed RNA polymerase subunit RPC12/RpoP
MLKCPYCGKKWNYKGKDKHYAKCSNCKKWVRIHSYFREGYKPFSKLKFKTKNYLGVEVKVEFT